MIASIKKTCAVLATRTIVSLANWSKHEVNDFPLQTQVETWFEAITALLALSNPCQDVGEEHLEDALAPWLLDYTFSIPMRRFSWAEATEAEFAFLRPVLEMRVLFHYDGTF